MAMRVLHQPMSLSDCRQCQTLWQAYLRAATQCIDLRMKQGTAAANGDVAAFKQLDTQLDAAEEARRKAKRQALEHQGAEHPEEMPVNTPD